MNKPLSSRSSGRFTLRSTVAWPVAAALPMICMMAFAGGMPTGAIVTGGKLVVTTPKPGSLQVNQSSQRGVIRWSDFSVGKGNEVTFAQPGTGSSTLNIVSGPNASLIAGSLKSTGSIFLVNPSGITITATGLVDTGAGFIASTLGISETDFMNGRLRFNGAGGAVVNDGRITAGKGGTVALLGSTVRNDGVINAPLGKVGLGSGQSATLDLGGDGFLQVLLPAGATTADGQALVDNHGVIQADGGTVVLRAATVHDAVRNAVNMPGEIRARSISGHDGAIVLDGGDGGSVAVAGRLDASASTRAVDGGRIDMSGATIALQGATVTATGVDQGGLVRIGGAFQGGKPQDAGSARAELYIDRFGTTPTLANATRTDIDATTSIDVSASGAKGVGGTAVVWSDQATTMLGRLDASGAKAGGAVEISSAAQIQQIALAKVKVGARGTLLLDPSDIQITDGAATGNTGDQTYASNPGGTTQISTSEILDQLDAGVNVSLQASNDITWNAFYAGVVPTGGLVNGGDLALSAGRSIMLSGAFNSCGGTWTMTANDTAAHGVVSAERQAGSAVIDLGTANFNNNNGHLDLSVLDGLGNAEHDVDGIRLGSYGGDSLTAYISPTATGPVPTRIMLADIQAAGSIILTGNLLSEMGQGTLSAQHVNWTNESTGGVIYGEGTLKFVENGVTTRFGTFNGVDAVRLGLGDGSVTSATRVYGDADPSFADLGSVQLHVLAGSANQPADALADILAPGALVTSGPGVTAPAGASTLTVGPSGSIATAGGYLQSGYFIDLTPAALPLTITRRTVTPTIGNTSYVYGSPTAAAGLANIVNGDILAPVATLNGTAGVTMSANGAGYGFDQKLGAGTPSFTLTGLAGAAASNYTLDLGGTTTGTVTIAPKPLTFVTGSGAQTYGTPGGGVSSVMSGVLAGDFVGHDISYESGGTGHPYDPRLPVGTYATRVSTLFGPDAANYAVATSGNTDGTFTVSRKTITWGVANAASTYGTLATPGGVAFGGALPGDDVTGLVTAYSGASPITLTATTHAGSYGEQVTGLAGTAAGNYTLAGTGNTAGTLTVSPKALTYTGNSISQTYGSTAVPTLTLSGIVGSDAVVGVEQVAGGSADVGGSGARTVGAYVATFNALTGANVADYTLASSGNTPGTLTITPKALTFAASSAASTYGTAATLAAPVLSGVLGGDAITGVATANGGSGVFTPASRTQVGTYTIGLQTSDLAGAGVSNYTIAPTGNTAGSLVVSPKPITWQVANSTATYGNAPSASTLFTGVLSGDAVSAQLVVLDALSATVARPDVGSYHTAVATISGADAANYVLSGSGNTAGALTVVPRPLTWAITNANSVYGNLATLGTITLSNVIAGDDAGAVGGIAASGTPVALTSRTHAGSYAEVVTALTNPNYVLSTTGNASGTLTIAPRPLTFTTADATTTYGTAVTTSATVAGVLAGDSVTAGTPVLQATGAAPTATQDAGSFALGLRSLAGPDASNYVVTDNGSSFGTLKISPKTVSYSLQGALYYSGYYLKETFQNLTHDYGDSREWYMWDKPVGRVNVTINGAIAGDDVSVATNAINFGLSGSHFINAGTYTYVGGALTGSKAGNYVLATTGNTNATLTIRPKTVEMQVWDYVFAGWRPWQGAAYYGSTAGIGVKTSVEYSSSIQSGDRVWSNVWFALPGGHSSTLPDRLPPGSYQMGGDLQGPDAGNYAPQVFAASFNVLPRPVTFISGDATVTYGDSAAIPATTLYGALPGEDVSVAASVYGISGPPGTALPARMPAGAHRVDVAGLVGRDASNYVFADTRDRNTMLAIGLPDYRWGNVQVLKRQLHYAEQASFNLTYGDILNGGPLTGVLSGDSVWLNETLQPIRIHDVWSPNAPGYWVNSLLPVGTYDWNAVVAGSSADNYYVHHPMATQSIGVVTVAPRPMSVVINQTDTVYGSYVAPSYSWVGLVRNQDIQPNLSVTADATGNAITYGQKTSAGSYTQAISGFVAPAGTTKVADPTLNYVFVQTPEASAKLNVAQKQLTFTPTTDATTNVYGRATQFGKLTGILFGDDVGVKAVDREFDTQRLVSDANGVLTYPTRLNAGTYDWTGSLVGAKSANYKIDPIATSVTVAPKPVIYEVFDASSFYGGYYNCVHQGLVCNPYIPGGTVVGWNGGTPFGWAPLKGVLPGDEVFGNVALTDLNGRIVPLDGGTHAGTYFEVVTGLWGRSGKNYRVADSGSKPGIYTVMPEWISYSTTSAIYFGKLIGTPGVPTLRGPGGPFSGGPDIHPIVTARDPHGAVVTSLDNLIVGRYTFEVSGLTGADAKDFQIAGHSDVGTLDVFSGTSLGLDYAKSVPQVPTIPAIVPAPVVTAPPLSGYISSGKTGQTPDFGRNINSTGDVGEISVGGLTGVGASGAASGVVEAGVDLGGGVNLSTQVSGAVTGLAKFGVTGVDLEATADAHIDITITMGPGYVEFGAQGDAYAIGKLDRNGLQIGAEAKAGASGQVGVGGDVSGLGHGTIDATVSTFVYARTDQQATIKDGKLIEKIDESVGVGVSVGTRGGVSGSAGSVDAGVTVYSPGSIGGTFNYAVGYSDGTLSVSLDLGAKLGIGGLDLKIGFSIDVNSAANTVAGWFGFHEDYRPDKESYGDALHAASISDPVARYNYLKDTPAFQTKPWDYDLKPEVAAAWNNQKAFYDSYVTLLQGTQALVAKEAADQATFLKLLGTDPTAAIAMAHSTDFVEAAQRTQSDLNWQAQVLGVQLAVSNGQLTYVTAPHH